MPFDHFARDFGCKRLERLTVKERGQRTNARLQMWRNVVARLGLASGGRAGLSQWLVATGSRDGISVAIEKAPDALIEEAHSITVTGPTSWRVTLMAKQQALCPNGPTLLFDEPPFDAAVLVAGAPSQITLVLDHSARALALRVVGELGARVEDSTIRLPPTRTRLFETEDEILSAVADMVRLATAFSQADDPMARAVRQSIEDPAARARAFADDAIDLMVAKARRALGLKEILLRRLRAAIQYEKRGLKHFVAVALAAEDAETGHRALDLVLTYGGPGQFAQVLDKVLNSKGRIAEMLGWLSGADPEARSRFQTRFLILTADEQAVVAQALSRINDDWSLVGLTGCLPSLGDLDSCDVSAIVDAINGLGRWGKLGTAEDELIELLKAVEYEIAASAARALGTLGTRRSFGPLTDAAEAFFRSTDVKRVAKKSLELVRARIKGERGGLSLGDDGDQAGALSTPEADGGLEISEE